MMKLHMSLALALWCAAMPASTFAQTDQGKISGIARDYTQVGYRLFRSRAILALATISAHACADRVSG